jgi:hypothetical protein
MGVKTLAQPSIKRRMFEDARDFADGLKATTRCAKCNGYMRGTVAEGKRWFEWHMEHRHGVIVRRKP